MDRESLAYVPVPRLLSELLSNASEAPDEVRTRFMCVVWIDVVGYSALAERLGQHRELGPEALAEALNATLAPCLRAVAELGGEVSHFAGDAFVAVFVAETAADRAAVVRAGARCAARCIEALRPEEVSARVLLSSGEVTLGLADAGDCRYLLLGGDTMEQLYASAGRAAANRCLVLPTAAAMLPTAALEQDASGRQWLRPETDLAADGAHGARVAPEPSAALEGFVHPHLRALRARAERIHAEYRHAAVLFFQLREPPDSTLPATRRAIDSVSQVVGTLGGQIMQLVRDDKGLLLIAVWGLPGSAFVDATPRALAAASEALQRLAQTGSSGKAGVATGLLYAGRRGASVRSEWAVVGEVPNLAAWLMSSAADGELLALPADVRHFSGRRLRAGTPREAARKHGAGNLRVVPVLRETDGELPQDTPGPIFGRTSELTALESAFSAWQAGAGKVVVLTGEVGIGKTHTLECFVARVRERGFRLDRLPCDQLQSDVPYRSILQLLRARLGADGSDLESFVRAGLGVLRYAEAEADLRLCASMLAAAAGRGAELPRGVEDSVPPALRRLIGAVLEQQPAGQPGALLVIDDAQWLDPASLALVADLARADHTLIIAAAREELFARDEWHDFARRLEITTLRLAELGVEDSARLTRHALQVTHIPDALIQLVHERALGVPLLTLEYLEWLRKQGLLRIEGARCSLASAAHPGLPRDALADAGVPSNLAALVADRVDGLGPRSRALLKLASAIGLIFSLADLRQLALDLGSADELERDVRALVHSGLWVVQPDAAQMTFAHAVIRQVVHDQMVPSERRDMHARIALQLEQQSAPAVPLAVLAYHYREAADADKALHYLSCAGRAALAAGAGREAVRSFERALPLADQRLPPLMVASLQFDAGRAFLLLSNYAAARLAFEACLRLAGEKPPLSAAAQLLGLLREALRQLQRRWRRPERRSLPANVPEQAETTVSSYDLLVQVYFYSKQPLPALYAALRSLNMAEQYGLVAGSARGSALVGGMLGLVPWASASRGYARRALALAEQLLDGPDRLWTLLVVATSAAGRGEWNAANPLLQRCVQLAGQLGDQIRWMDAVGNLGYNLVFAGRVDEGYRLLNSGRERAYALRDERYQLAADRSLLLPLILQTQKPLLREHLARLRRTLEQGDNPEEHLARVELEAAEAWLSAAEKSPEQARHHALAALTALEAVGAAGVFYNAAWAAACTAHVLLALDPAHADAARARRMRKQFARVYPYIEQLQLPAIS